MTDSIGSGALARYQYLLRTSSPDQIEQAHANAFAAMTDAERREVLQALAGTSEPATDASPTALARAATRYEVQQPGGLQQLLGTSGVTGSNGRSLLTALAAGAAGAAAWTGMTGGDGIGGRPGILSRLFGLGRGLGYGGFEQGGRGFGGGYHQGGGQGMFGGMFGGGPGGGPGGPGGGPGGPGGFGGGPGGGPGGF